jgi:hypothetical protein
MNPKDLFRQWLMTQTDVTWTSTEGLPLVGRSWEPAGEPRAVVCLVHDRLSARLGIELLQPGEWALAHAAEFPAPPAAAWSGQPLNVQPDQP